MIETDLLDRLRLLEDRVRHAVERFSSADSNPEDAFRGLYLSEEDMLRLMARDGQGETTLPRAFDGPDSGTRLGRLAHAFHLDPLDLEILVCAMGPDLDRRYESYYGYLHDDVTRRRASPDLVVELLGLSNLDGRMRRRFAAEGPLVRAGLLVVEDVERPFLTRGLRVPDRVTGYLLGDLHPDPVLDAFRIDPVLVPSQVTIGLDAALRAPTMPLYLREQTAGSAISLAVAALTATDQTTAASSPLVVDLGRPAPEDRCWLAAVAVRDVGLTGSGLIAGPVEELDRQTVTTLLTGRGPVILYGQSMWDPALADRTVLPIDVPPLTAEQRKSVWVQHLETETDGTTAIASTFRLGPSQIRRAAEAGAGFAAVAGASVGYEALATGARAQSSAGLERLARRIRPEAGWDSIVLPEVTVDQLLHLVDRVSHRHVLGDWGLHRGGGRGEGITALFAGDSGTGKTLAAEVIASALELDLYVIDLSSVVDKYIGETEKNLDRVFGEAEGVNGVLFFDEADALFGKRSEISDAKDRYANVEVAYLLQRMEQFDGLAVLASNLRGNLDEAFARRLSLIVDFPDPDVEHRIRLWQVLMADAPTGPDVNLDALAQRFELSGGNIRNVVVTAAYLAASHSEVIGMAHLVRGIELEYRKLGRLCLDDEFGPFHHLLRSRESAVAG